MRSAMERIFSRFAQGYRFERHYIRGHEKMKARATLTAAVMMAMARSDMFAADGNSRCVHWSGRLQCLIPADFPPSDYCH